MSIPAPTIRPAAPRDSDLLFAWVNRPDVLQNKMMTRGEISRATHDAWFKQRIASPSCQIYIVRLAQHDCGQIRFEDKGEGFEVDIFMLPAARGRGHSRLAMAIALADLARRHGPRVVLARILIKNESSTRFFLGLGFRKIASDDVSHTLATMLSPGTSI